MRRANTPRHFQKTLFDALFFAGTLIALAAGILFSTSRVINVCVVSGSSMAPTIEDGSVLLANRLSYEEGEVRRGDIIVFRHGGQQLVKRVVGIPGDTVSFDYGYVIVNGSILDERYLADDCYSFGSQEYTVPDGYYFVLGDNRTDSYDSRTFWDTFIRWDEIEGRGFLQIGKSGVRTLGRLEES